MQSQKTYPSSVWLALGSVYLIWGSTYLAIRFAVETIPPFFMAGSRFLAAGIVLYAWMRFRGAARPSKRHWRSAAFAGFLLLTVGNGGVSWAASKVPSGVAALLVATVPLWTVLLEWLVQGGKRPSWTTWLGIVVGMSGIALLVFSRGGAGAAEPWACLLLVVTSLIWSYGALYSRAAALPSSPLLGTAMQMIAGGALQWIVGLLLGEQYGVRFDLMTSHSVWAWVYLTLIGSLVGFTSYIWVLNKSTPALASTYAFVNPVIAVFLGWFLAGESVTSHLFLSAGLIVAAVGLITLSPKNQHPTQRRKDAKKD